MSGTDALWSLGHTRVSRAEFEEHLYCRACGSELVSSAPVTSYDHRTGEPVVTPTKKCPKGNLLGGHTALFVDDSVSDNVSNPTEEAPNRAQEG